MKKSFAGILILGSVMLALTGCGKESTDSSSSGPADKNTFTVGFDQDFPPMGFMDEDGEFTGFDLELAAETAKRMGLTI
mgnify:FL=1